MTNPDSLVLYTYFRSSAAFRTRIALNLKGLSAEQVFVHLRKNEQGAGSYLKVNPQGLVPALTHKGVTITQSLAIIEYLDEVWPEPPLLPPTPAERAHVREIAYAIACDIHPVNNLRIRNYLEQKLHRSEDEILAWQVHWMQEGFAALETMLVRSGRRGKFVYGDQPTLADICLIPQMANARGAKMDLSPYPSLLAIEKAAYELRAFSDALPRNQPDAE